MTEPDDARCPSCGAAATSRYCPHCGARTGWTDLLPPAMPDQATVQVPPATVQVPPATVQVRPATPGGAPPSAADADAPTVPAMPAVARPAPPRAVPEMFSTEFLPVAGPAQAWSQPADPSAAPGGAAPGLFPGWTGMHPAVAVGGAPQLLAPRPERRRKAIYAVLGIAAATVVVVLAALLIAPNWRGTAGTADKIAPGPAVSSPSASTTPPPSTATTAAPTRSSGVPGTAAGVPPVRTVTVTAPTGTGASTPGPTPPSPRPSTAKPTAKPTPRPTAPAPPLGVPQRDIACSGGYIVQLASELDEPRFKARVATLKAAGRLPAGALAADSARSCRIFTSQVNTLVLYSGPFPSKYDGCAARLAGPADAYIKGGNADSAREYVSCLCPAATAGLPRYSAVGQQGVWVGELQRVLANRLGIDIPDLSANWGRFTVGTQAAVRAFQQAAQLPGNGVVDAGTWRALQSAEC